METKEFIDQFNKDWSEFKKANDQLIQAKADGKAVGDLETKIAALSAALDKHNETAARLAQVEAAIKRTGFSTKDDGPTAAQVEHKQAFNAWFRRGGDEGALAGLQTKALAVNDDTSGGFLVHADISGRIIKRIFETSPIRQFAAVASISTDALEGITDTDEASAGWVAERGSRSETNTPKIGAWRIPTHEIYAAPTCTQKLLDDAAFSVEEWLSGKVADKFARTEATSFVSGSGVGQPKGFLAYTTIAEDASLNFTDLKKIGFIKTGKANAFPDAPAAAADPGQANPLIDLVLSLKTAYREMPGTAFAMHRTTLAAVRKLRDSHGQYLWQPSIQAGTPATLMGYPVIEMNDMPVLGATNKNAIAFANWRESYQIVDRVGVRVLRDPYTRKPFVEFYTTKRVGGDVLNFEAIKLLSFSA